MKQKKGAAKLELPLPLVGRGLSPQKISQFLEIQEAQAKFVERELGNFLKTPKLMERVGGEVSEREWERIVKDILRNFTKVKKANNDIPASGGP